MNPSPLRARPAARPGGAAMAQALPGLSGIFNLILTFACAPGTAGEFYAHYTRVASDPEVERSSRTGDRTDVVVVVGDAGGRLVFCRATSYLPFWETSRGKWPLREIVPRRGDGPAGRPDRVNTYSHARIVESTGEEAVVHWRYLPEFGGSNPHTGLSPTSFVDEYFKIRADGAVTRTVRQGTEKYADWLDPLQCHLQECALGPDGIRELRLVPPRKGPAPRPATGSPILDGEIGAPVCIFRLDEGAGDVTVEAAGGARCPIEGRSTLWKRGISGHALQFDDVTTAIRLPAEAGPTIQGSLTLEGWVALGAYPWNRAPIVQLGDEERGEIFLGVDSRGRPEVRIGRVDTFHDARAEEGLALRRWYHLAGAFDAASGVLELFVDGRKAASTRVPAGPLPEGRMPVRLGRGDPMRPSDPVRASTFVASYSLDGIIDEVRIHDRPVGPDAIAESHRRGRAGAGAPPDLPPRHLPRTRLETSPDFGARYVRLEYHEAWDALWRFGGHADVVVAFDDSPCCFVFWRGMGYIPALVNEKDQWYSNEFNETWGRSGGQGCQEPMSDKEAYSNRVYILESTPARAVVLWRYPLKDVLHVHANHDERTGWSDWSDWCYYIYPDGVAAKRMRLWTDGPRNHEWHEAMAILGPGQRPEDVLETEPALVLADLDGNAERLSWVHGPPAAPDYRQKRIHVVNYRAEHDPFTIGEFQAGDVYSGEVTPYSVFPSWNHWPVAQIPSDGRYASFPDRAAHCSLTHVRVPDREAETGEPPYQEKVLLEGMTRRGPSELATLARSWLRAPPTVEIAGALGGAHDPGERAYLFAAKDASLSFRIDASPERPLVNPCFVVRNWGCDARAVVGRDGVPVMDGPSVRQGIVRDPEGIQQLVVWLALEAVRPTAFSIAGARPRDLAAAASAPRWAVEPRAADDGLAAEMEVAAPPLAGKVRYCFERIGEGGSTGAWQESPRHLDAGLRPETSYAWRVKALTPYFDETPWSPEVSVRTGTTPPPAAWTFDGEVGPATGAGGRVAESSGRFPGEVRGKAERVPGRGAVAASGASRALQLGGAGHVLVSGADRLRTSGDFTWLAWIRTERGGAIVARAGREAWEPGGKVWFIEGGVPTFDAGWVGAVRGRGAKVDDGAWHHVAVSVRASRPAEITLYVDGRPAGSGTLDVGTHPEDGLPLKIGHCNQDFPSEAPGFVGDIDEVRWYPRALGTEEIEELRRG